MTDFSATLATAADADRTAALLLRAARAVKNGRDESELAALAQRYSDYAEALRQTIPRDEAADDEQVALL